METGRDALAGLRILIVEDEFLVAMLVEEMLQDLRCEIVGPVSTLEEAVATVRSRWQAFRRKLAEIWSQVAGV